MKSVSTARPPPTKAFQSQVIMLLKSKYTSEMGTCDVPKRSLTNGCYQVLITLVPGDSMPSSGLHGDLACIWCTYIHSGKDIKS